MLGVQFVRQRTRFGSSATGIRPGPFRSALDLPHVTNAPSYHKVLYTSLCRQFLKHSFYFSLLKGLALRYTGYYSAIVGDRLLCMVFKGKQVMA
jgi:hypothetical protein